MTPMTPNYGAGFGNAINDKMRRKAGIERNSGKKPASRTSRGGAKGGTVRKKTKGGYR